MVMDERPVPATSEDGILGRVTGVGEAPAAGPAGGPGRKPWAKVLQTVAYDPEKGFRESDLTTTAPDYARRFAVFPGGDPKDERHHVRVPGYESAFVPREIEGQTLFWRQAEERWVPAMVRSAAELRQFNEAEGHATRLMEQFGFDFGDGSDRLGGAMGADRLLNAEYVPIMAGPFFKQLYIYDYLKMHATAFEMVNHSALAAAATKIMMRFVLGRGISFHVKHDKAREVWDEFTERNNYRDKLRQMARDLPWQGELMLRLYEKQRGFVTLRVLDCSTCWEVVTDPEDFEHVFYYHFQWPAPYQIWVSGQIPVTKYIIQQIPPTNIIHVKINVSSQEKRGRSDLMPAMPFIKRFNDFYSGQTLKAVLEANLVFKIKLKGDQADVDAFLANPALTELGPAGSTWIENEAVDLQPTSATLTASRGSGGIGQQLAAIVAASMNLPNEYFNIEAGPGGAARATALVRTDPAVKTIEDRQQILREQNERVYERVMAAAYLAGRLPKEAAREEPEAGADPGETAGVGRGEQDMRMVQARILRTVAGRR
jgi:hypothetical protein